MFTFIELFYSFIIAIGLIFLFKLQRELSPRTYFSMSDIIYGINSIPTRMDIIIRVFIILVYGTSLNFIFQNSNVILFGLTLGSFLIVWPAFLSDQNIHYSVLDKKLLVYTLLTIFVVLTYLIAKMSLLIYNVIIQIFDIYLENYNLEKVILTILDNFIWMVFIMIIGAVIGPIRKVLAKSITPFEDKNIEKFENENEEIED